MNTYYLLFAIPLFSIWAIGILHVWDEMNSNKAQLPIENMNRLTAKVEFGLLQPMMGRSLSEPLGLRDERIGLYTRRRAWRALTVAEDAQIAPLVVVGAFSVLGPLTQGAAAKSEPIPDVIVPLAQPVGITAWIPSAQRDPRADA
jgi:hypothetical protein